MIGAEPRSIAAADVERFRATVVRRLGLAFEDGKLDFLAEVLQRRMSARGDRAYSAYSSRLDGRDELRLLATALTIGETYFFRHREQLDAFLDVAARPDEQPGGAPRRLRVLSAGSASGEELYSLAILLRERVPDIDSWDVQLHGVDVNPEAVDRARKGVYSAWSLRATPEEAKERWFEPTRAGFAVDPSLRRMVSFDERNLVEDDSSFWRPAAFDVVFCRNVLMYFSPEQMSAAIARISSTLVPSGFLFLGHAETLRGVTQEFHLCHTHETFYYRKRAVGEAATAPSVEPRTERSAHATQRAVPSADEDVSWVAAIGRASERIELLSRGKKRDSAIGAAPLTPRFDSAQAMELLKREHFQEALELLHESPESLRSDKDARVLHAVLLTNAGRLDEAEVACLEILEADDLDAGAHYLMALCREHAGDLAGAVEHDQAASYLDPSFVMPHLHRGVLARRRGEHERARAELSSALALLPREDASRILLFGGGFSREALAELCRAELRAAGATP